MKRIGVALYNIVDDNKISNLETAAHRNVPEPQLISVHVAVQGARKEDPDPWIVSVGPECCLSS